MKSGDLVRTVFNLYGSKHFPRGELGLILGPARTPEGREFEWIAVLIMGVIEDIHPSNLEVINEAR